MKIIKLSDEMYVELVQIVNIAISESIEWLKCCERDADLEHKYISDAKDDLTKAKNLLNNIYKAESES